MSMECLKTIEALGALAGPVHLAIGVFDGVHRGHQAVLRSACERAVREGGTPVASTFDPHPAEVLAPDRAPRRLTPLAHQRVLFERVGLPRTLAIPFDHVVAAQSAESFIEDLVRACQLGGIHVGIDWTFGRERRGDLKLLKALGERRGFAVEGVSPVMKGGERISSSRIREALREGDFGLVARLLGRPFSFFGPVVRGEQLGRKLGFPTANIDFGARVEVPHGVYAVRVPSHGNRPGVANLGVRPSVNGASELRFEVHLFDWSGSLYGEVMEAELVDHLRPERRFDSLEALKAQIARDMSDARSRLGI